MRQRLDIPECADIERVLRLAEIVGRHVAEHVGPTQQRCGDRIDLGGTICLAIATADDVVSRYARLAGGREWVRLGAVEMGLDSLRRYLQDLPVRERSDFEQGEKV